MQQKLEYSKVIILSIISLSCIVLLDHIKWNVYAVEGGFDSLDNYNSAEINNSGEKHDEILNITDTVINVTDSALIDLRKADDALNNGNNTEAKRNLAAVNQLLLDMKKTIEAIKSNITVASTIQKE